MMGMAWAWLLAVALSIPAAAPVGRVRQRARPKNPRDGPRDPLDAASDLELFAACLDAGLSLPDAVGAVASAAEDGTQSAWASAAALMGIGVPTHAAWAALREDPHLAELARLAEMSGESGAALSTGCHRLVAQLRAEASAQATAKAERAGVFIAAPLAVCFLPAFIVLGLAPVIISLGEKLL